MFLSDAILIAGPTGIGKSNVGIEVAKVVDGEIISADSVQIYKEMNAATNKVSPEARKEIPHHMIDICDIHDDFSTVDFYAMTKGIIEDIKARRKVPIIVGGTGFYFRTIIYGPPEGPPPDFEYRKKLRQDLEKFGKSKMHEILMNKDEKYGKTVSVNDEKKILRALEIIHVAGKPVSDLKYSSHEQNSVPKNCKAWFLYREMRKLYEILDKRCEDILNGGIVDELLALKNRGLEDCPSPSKAIGYRQCLQYLNDNDEESFAKNFKKATRNYAKRQMTWFRKEPIFRRLNLEKISMQSCIKTICNDYISGQ